MSFHNISFIDYEHSGPCGLLDYFFTFCLRLLVVFKISLSKHSFRNGIIVSYLKFVLTCDQPGNVYRSLPQRTSLTTFQSRIRLFQSGDEVVK